MLEVAQAQAAVFLRRGDPMQAERAHLRPEVAGKEVVAVDRRGARRDLLLGEGRGRCRGSSRRSRRGRSRTDGARWGSWAGSSRGWRRRPWRQSAAFGKAGRGGRGSAQAGSKSSQIQQNPAKANPKNQRKRLGLIGLAGIEPFQGLALTPELIFISPPGPPPRSKPGDPNSNWPMMNCSFLRRSASGAPSAWVLIIGKKMSKKCR